MKSMMMSGEILLLSYGFGVFRITSIDDISLDNEALSGMGFVELSKIGDGVYVGLTDNGHIPSKMEMAIHQTEEFISDKEFVVKFGSDKLKNRFKLFK